MTSFSNYTYFCLQVSHLAVLRRTFDWHLIKLKVTYFLYVWNWVFDEMFCTLYLHIDCKHQVHIIFFRNLWCFSFLNYLPNSTNFVRINSEFIIKSWLIKYILCTSLLNFKFKSYTNVAISNMTQICVWLFFT